MMIPNDNTGNGTFFTGPQSRNSDGLHHANVLDVGSGAFSVGFEDIAGGGDQDFNDAIFRVLGGALPDPNITPPTGGVPQPGTLLLLSLGAALASLSRCKKR
jgi:hypothetical protein